MHDNRTNGKFKMPLLRFARASLVGTFLTLSPKNSSLSVLPLLAAVLAMALLFAAMANSVPAEAQSLTDYDADNDGLIEVSSLAQLDAIRYDLDGDGSPTNSTAYDAAFPNVATGMGCPSSGCIGYELTTNLDFDTNGDGRTDIAGDDYWNDGAGWEPITDSARGGSQDATFHATFEGNSHVITGLYIDRSGEGNVGFFGRVWGGEIRNVGLEGVIVKGERDTGGLVGSISSGLSYDSLISASYVTGSVSGGSLVGGLVGYNRAPIDASYAAVSVSGTSNIGGLVGNNHSGGSISASYATGSVTGVSQAGGLVGSNQAGSVTESYATGSVSGTGFYVGGLAGDSGSGTTITASYATGSVSGRVAGGLVGSNLGAIADSYAIGAVPGSSSVGGLVGANSALTFSGTVTTSYWDTETSGQSTSAGGEGKTTAELQSPTSNTGIYATWDSNVWDFGTSGQYPTLRGVGGSATPAQSPDRAALVALYNATDGDNWTNNTNWLSDEPLDDWYGVTTDAEGRVTRLTLSSNNLAGTIPSELGTLSNLEDLLLNVNQLTGAIPLELGSLSSLVWLDLRANQLTGAIPAELGSLSNLELLYLSSNDLTGVIPTELGSLSNLDGLILGWNELTGVIPTELGSLSNLEQLDLSLNQLTGAIPTELGNLSNLEDLWLSNNQLTGTIPTELGSMSNLTKLWLSGNLLTGAFPQNFTNLTALEEFRFSDNAGLCAPTDAAFQSWLQAISIRDNGPNCADASTELTDREILVALYNATDGDNWEDNTNWLSDEPIGDWHGITTGADGQVTELSLGRNNLTGVLPIQLGNLSYLETLWLGGNQLTGAIPAQLGSLSSLDYLGLESNALTGAIPTELGNLSSLTWLALNGNQLTGALPQSFTSLSALDDFAFSDNSGLCAPTDAAFQTWLQGISNSNMSTEVAVPFGPNCDDSQPTTDSCVEPLTGDGAINDSWADDCDSENRSGSYARYYTFTLTEQSDVTITLESSEDTYLFLLDGHGTNGRKLHENDDHITSSGCTAAGNFDSCIAETLEPGNYTIEATTLDAATTGDFTLTLEISAASQQPTPPPPGPQPTPAPGVVVSAGPNHACALDTNGEIACQGVNDFNQVSDRPTSSGFVAVSVGDKHSCAIDANGSVECWGSNEHGQSSAPSNGTFLAIGAGDNYTCALRSDNSLECWGRFEAVDSGAPTPPAPPPTTPGPTPAPDLAVDAPTVSDSSPTAGASFTLNATVRNRGDGAAASTTLRYIQSTDSSITTSDTEVGTASVNGLSASGSSSETISLIAPSTAGTYYYGACVDAVSGESDTGNNCSTAVAVTVGAAPQPTAGPFTVAITTCSGTRDSSGVGVEMGGTVTATRDVSVTSLTVTGTANGSTVDTVSMKNGRWQAGETQNWSMSGTISTSSSTLSCEATLRGSIQSGSGTSISSSMSAATEQQITD